MSKWIAALALAFAIGLPASYASASVMNTTKGMRLTILPVMGAGKEEAPPPNGKVRVEPVAVNKATGSGQVAHGAKGAKTRQAAAKHKAAKPNARNKG